MLPWEDAAEYRDLVASLVAEHAPHGPTEEHLVEELAGVLWRKRRLRLAEAAAHRHGLKEALSQSRRFAKRAVVHLDAADGSEEVSLTDVEVAKHWALDDDGDPVWRDRPLVGSEKEIREAARWNSRHGGKKLDERAKLVGHRHMWRGDIIERLVKIRDASADADAVPPPCKQAR